MNSYFYNDVIENFIAGNSNSVVLPSSMSKTDVDLIVGHVSSILDKSKDKTIIDKCNSLINILKGKVKLNDN